MNKLYRLANELLNIREDLFNRVDVNNERLNPNDFEICVFEQLWGSTALGFGGFGGSAMTTANTTVLIPNRKDADCYVYFDGRFAYCVPYSNIFAEDVKSHMMEPVYQISKYIRSRV